MEMTDPVSAILGRSGLLQPGECLRCEACCRFPRRRARSALWYFFAREMERAIAAGYPATRSRLADGPGPRGLFPSGFVLRSFASAAPLLRRLARRNLWRRRAEESQRRRKGVFRCPAFRPLDERLRRAFRAPGSTAASILSMPAYDEAGKGSMAGPGHVLSGIRAGLRIALS